jgi:hypothetical protein
MLKNYDQRLADLERMTGEIHEMLKALLSREEGRSGYVIRPSYAEAIREAAKGNTRTLALFKQRGGVIPGTDRQHSENN